MITNTMILNTYIGDFEIRDNWDLEVVTEVLERDEYRRWGDITINKGDLVFDLGAHLGSFSRLALYLEANVVAVEPNEDNFKLLERNIELGKPLKSKIELVNAAVGVEGTANLMVVKERNELHKIVPSATEQTVEVRSVSLDYLIQHYGPVDLLKLDIEGSEYGVLYGSKKLDQIEQITMEWHYGATKLSELIIYLESHGFKTAWLGGNGEWGKLQMKHR